MSILELNEKAANHIEEIRRANVEKSKAKIKELTEEHKKKKNGGNLMADESDEEVKIEEGEKAGKKKNGSGNREPLEKQHENKGTVSSSKLANKRIQKEALKKNKAKREKGTLKDNGPPRNGKKSDEGAATASL